ncbi:hypothetical protein CYMTET_17876 [Cymbomonas tetramitiformis]|uniref:UBA domain-containing protein n=1 Tax=Cymbomonas tetramitiformis TaxID=36881 RepID=A0AAE0G9D5_9CHLO|nr:hypothetical protein CYMTET_17876 [Cymbomonas tetramitiformis]
MQSNIVPPVNVNISPAFRLTPSGNLSGYSDVPQTVLPFEDLELEQKVIGDLKTTYEDCLDPSAGMKSPALNDEWHSAVTKFTNMGCDKEAASFAVAAYGDQEEKVLEFAKEYSSLKDMGFSTEKAVGALVMHDNKLDLAVAACCISD